MLRTVRATGRYDLESERPLACLCLQVCVWGAETERRTLTRYSSRWICSTGPPSGRTAAVLTHGVGRILGAAKGGAPADGRAGRRRRSRGRGMRRRQRAPASGGGGPGWWVRGERRAQKDLGALTSYSGWRGRRTSESARASNARAAGDAPAAARNRTWALPTVGEIECPRAHIRFCPRGGWECTVHVGGGNVRGVWEGEGDARVGRNGNWWGRLGKRVETEHHGEGGRAGRLG